MAHARYLDHLKGLSLLMAWRERWSGVSGALTLKDQVLTLGAPIAQRFAWGVPTHRRWSPHAFLAAQREERLWLESVVWERAWIEPAGDGLVLVAARVNGDDNVPDVPAFAVRWPIAQPELGQALLQGAALDVRGVWVDPDGRLRLEPGRVARCPLARRAVDQPVCAPDALAGSRSFEALLEERLLEGALPEEPVFEGDRPVVDAQFRDLVQPLVPSFDNGLAPLGRQRLVNPAADR